MPSLSPLVCPPSVAHCPRSARFNDQSSPGPSPLDLEPPSEIIPRLFIGGADAAESEAVLNSLKITHILSVTSGSIIPPTAARLPYLTRPLQRLQLSLQDSPFAELVAILPRATAFIAAALQDPAANVLVHCMQGVSRSPSVVAAYLIAYRGCSPEQALKVVKGRRRCADPNPGFVKQLEEFEQTLQRRAYEYPGHHKELLR